MLKELSYRGNLGVMEMVKFIDLASPDQKQQLQLLMDEGNMDGALALIQSVTGTKLFLGKNKRAPTSPSRGRLQLALNARIYNPETKNHILVGTALKYGPQHPAYRTAKQYLSRVLRAKDESRVVEDVLPVEAIEDHLRKRGVDPDKIQVVIDKSNNLATFFLYNLSGQLVGYQRYNPAGDKTHGAHGNTLAKRYFTWITKESPKVSKIAVWGLEYLDDAVPYVFVTEGIFDAVKLINAGQPAVAVLANNPQPLRTWFQVFPKKTIAVEDNDAAGSKLGNVTDYRIKVPAPYKDLGDMPQDEVNKFVSRLAPRPEKDTTQMMQRIINPQTGNKILIKTALKYAKEHPAYKAALRVLGR